MYFILFLFLSIKTFHLQNNWVAIPLTVSFSLLVGDQRSSTRIQRASGLVLVHIPVECIKLIVLLVVQLIVAFLVVLVRSLWLSIYTIYTLYSGRLKSKTGR